MTDRLAAYRGKRTAGRTPEPMSATGKTAPREAGKAAPGKATPRKAGKGKRQEASEATPSGADDTFVVQEHHARSLHWDFRLERGGVLVSWAIPKGLPAEPGRNRLAVQTEDHPLEYGGFAGEIPAGEYGAGQVYIWDRGRYECEKWSDREVKVVLHGERARGRYVLVRTGGKNWLVHRMDPPAQGTAPMPEDPRPMLATAGRLPAKSRDAQYAYEPEWGGRRALVSVEGGRVRVSGADGHDISAEYPRLRALGKALGATRVVLDGELLSHPLGGRRGGGAAYVISDLLYLDGEDTTALPFRERRERLEALRLRGPAWDTPPLLEGDGRTARATAQELGLPGIVAKRLDSPYQPGQRTRDWISIPTGPSPAAH